MGRKKLKLVVLCATVGAALLGASSAAAWTVTMDANPKLKRTYGWTISKRVDKPALTLKAGESANVTYSVTVTPGAPVDSDWSVSGTMEMTEDPAIEVGSVVFRVIPAAANTPEILASHSCMPSTFPVDLGVAGLTCTYSASLPDASARRAWMRATTTDVPPGFRNVLTPFDFSAAEVELVDESVTVTDSMAGVLGTANAAGGAKTFTYTRKIGPFTTSQCGMKKVDNVASIRASDSGATASASASVNVTVTCAPPPCKDKGKDKKDKKHGWYGGDKSDKGGYDDECEDDEDDCRDHKGKDKDDDRDGKSSKGKGYGGHDDDDCRDDDRDDHDHDHDRDDDDKCRGDHKYRDGKGNGWR